MSTTYTDLPILGMTLSQVVRRKLSSEIFFVSEDRSKAWKMFHSQDCCESVSIDAIDGDLESLVGAPLLIAEEAQSERESAGEYSGTQTWTFYRFRTIKGFVSVRWHGESNGYYSETVQFEEIDPQSVPEVQA